MELPADTKVCHQIEEDLIKACAVTVTTEDRRATIISLVGECRDWSYVVEACRTHGISSLVGRNLEAHAPGLVPGKVRDEFQARFKANACRNLFLTQELLALIQEFRRKRIEVIPFKGPLLAVTAYGNVALREFFDLDILVQKRDLGLAREMLAARGYRSRATQFTETYLHSQLGWDLISADRRAALELHWSFVQKWLGFRVDLDSIWADPHQILVGTVPVRVLPQDITLLYLCAHGAKHYWNRLCWVVDVAEILRAYPEREWAALLTRAENSGCQRTLFIGLHLAKTLLGASVPEAVWLKVKKDKMALSIAGSRAEQMFEPRKDTVRDGSGWMREWFYIRTKERWREKLVCLYHVAQLVFQPSDKDRDWIRLPQWLNWLYVLLRPIRVTYQSLPWTRGNEAYRVA